MLVSTFDNDGWNLRIYDAREKHSSYISPTA
ncbi:hypothetical protein A2U01_0067929, partial [Trifolium medium]|nr:hypothetical protein [Trifolium medium]